MQQTSLAVQEAELEISHSAIRVGIGQIAAGVLQTLMIAGGLLLTRSKIRARKHARRSDDAIAVRRAQQKQHKATLAALDVQRRAMETLIDRTSEP